MRLGLSLKLTAGRGVLLGSLVALASGCQTEELEVEDANVQHLEQDLTPLRERSCQDIKNANASAGDGDYVLYVLGDPSWPWKAYCRDMAGTPTEYLPLPESSSFSNFAQYTAGDAAPGTSVRTVYSKLRIHPITLRVDTSDRTFATSTGQLFHAGNPITSMPFATAMSCDWSDSGRASIDLRGTPFKVAPEHFAALGYAQSGSQTYSFACQVVTLKGGGYCGWNAPLNADAFLGGSLPLHYTIANTAWSPIARVYPMGGSTTDAQSFQPGFYDAQDLRLGTQGIGAVHVPRGWSITLYGNTGFTGTTRTLTADTDVPGTDRWARSLKVEAPVLVYSGHGHQGTSQLLRAGRYDIGQLTVGNDTLRSLKVPEGFQVTLYRDGGFSGGYVVFTQDTDLAGHPFNAQTSSIVVESTTARHGNIIHGRWSSSGGQNASSPDNRQLIVEYTGRPDIVSFELESSVAPYLYLLDANGQVLLQANDVIGDNRARISYFLSPGTYKLVAATSQSGRTADFTLRSDKARLRYPQRLSVKAVSSFDWIYDDHNTGAHDDISVWRPNRSQVPGYYSLGDVAMPRHGLVPRMTYVVSGEGDLLARPVDYAHVWDDGGTGGTHDVAFWRPVPPAGYTCLGSVVQLGYDKPSTDLIRCVKSAYVLPAGAGWVWNDKGSGGHGDVTVWQADAPDHRTLTASTMVGQGHYDDPDGSLFWALNKSALANPELQGGFVDDLTALQFAPRVWLHPNESFFPSSTPFFVQNMVQETARLRTRDALGCDACTNPPFLKGQRPDSNPVPMYAQIIPRTQAGLPTNVTDIVYWTFYPYNQGKQACLNNLTVPFCASGFSTVGNHVGDWEHLTVRFIDGRPASLAMSQNVGRAPSTFGSKDLPLLDFRPEVYAAQGSHGLYPEAAQYSYLRQNNPNQRFIDDTARGIAWNGWESPVIFPWQPAGTYSGPSMERFNITAEWGNDKSGCQYEITRVTGDCILNPGAKAPMSRSFTHPSTLTLE